MLQAGSSPPFLDMWRAAEWTSTSGMLWTICLAQILTWCLTTSACTCTMPLETLALSPSRFQVCSYHQTIQLRHAHAAASEPLHQWIFTTQVLLAQSSRRYIVPCMQHESLMDLSRNYDPLLFGPMVHARATIEGIFLASIWLSMHDTLQVMSTLILRLAGTACLVMWQVWK